MNSESDDDDDDRLELIVHRVADDVSDSETESTPQTPPHHVQPERDEPSSPPPQPGTPKRPLGE